MAYWIKSGECSSRAQPVRTILFIGLYWALDQKRAAVCEPLSWGKVPDRILVCHADARSAKVQEIMNCSQTSWLFYHPEKKIQVRISGQTSLHSHDTHADRQWADSSITSRLNYCTSQPPGTAVDQPSSGLPDFLLNKIPTLLETERCRKNFMVIRVHIFSIDWLLLKITGHRRALFEWDKDRLRSTWLIP